MSNILPDPLLSGNSFTIALTFNNLDGSVKDMTGYVVGCTVKSNISDKDGCAKFQQDLRGDTTGKISFGVVGLPVGSYWIDVVQWDASNVRSSVIVPTQFSINQSVTDRTTPSP